MTTLTSAVAAYLGLRGLGVYSETVAYRPDEIGLCVGDMPADPDRVIVLSGYPMAPPQGSSNQPERITRLRFTCRSASYSESWEMCEAVSDLLDGHPRVTLPGGIVLCNAVSQQQVPLDQGVDNNNRHRHQTVVEFEYLPAPRTP